MFCPETGGPESKESRALVISVTVQVLCNSLRMLQRGIGAVFPEQLVPASHLFDVAVVDYGNAVGVPHRRKPVRNDDAGLPAAQPVETCLNLLLGNAVERRGRPTKL